MLLILSLLACGNPAPSPVSDVKPVEEPAKAPEAPKAAATLPDETLRKIFQPLPDRMESPNNPLTPEKVALGRMLYYEPRISKNQDISCNSCHLLDQGGDDNSPTSTGHKKQLGARNAPTVYNAALHFKQFWDGRADDVEAQAKGPILNPIEMGMSGEPQVLTVLQSIPGYDAPFKAAFPGEADPYTYDNLARAIGAFERTLVTPSRFDAWLKGDDTALTPDERAGLDLFVTTGCNSCHFGVGIGGSMYRKLGERRPYDTPDGGLMEVTKKESDRHMFKVPSLRNVAETGPYFHDGSISTLEEAVKRMGAYQLDKDLTDAEIASIVTFLKTASGKAPPEQIAKPELPPSGPDTPKPDPG